MKTSWGEEGPWLPPWLSHLPRQFCLFFPAETLSAQPSDQLAADLARWLRLSCVP